MAGPSDGAKGFAFFIVNMELTEEGEGKVGVGGRGLGRDGRVGWEGGMGGRG